ncbi:MAG: Fic family protein [Blastocatellia bacterium]
MEPLYPARTGELEDLARELVAVSAQLEGRLAPVALREIEGLLRVVNSYYSNLIEGHNTHPVDIERAMQSDYSAEQDKRDLQLESRIHIEAQGKLAERLRAEPQTNVASAEFLCWLHREFYESLPERLRWVGGKDGERVWVEAGVLRNRHVQVGQHIAPAPESLEQFLQRFAQGFDPATAQGLRPVIALAAAHHRLTWIHPFLDGNGRVVRLFTDAYFSRIKLRGYGLWNVSRGLARRRDEYRQFLATADSPRESDLDGRGNLSDRRLTEFCRFFLEICLDQATYMNGLLALNGFLDRLEKYVSLRNAGLIVNSAGQAVAPVHPRVAELLKTTAIRGEITRGEAFRIIEMSERTGRNILKGLLDEGLLSSPSEKGPVRLSFPATAASYWFPDLYPHEVRR